MISLVMNEPRRERVGSFKSYVDIGEYLSKHGETGKYFAIPDNIKSIAGMREIIVINHGPTPKEKVLIIKEARQ